MRRALRLARKGEGVASPNPMVGAVVVKGEKVVADGWHRGPGTAHAEAIALKKAGKAAEGATLYVSLEPCVHVGNMPACAPVVVGAGIVRVVVAMEDPDVRVAGKGLAHLRDAGLEVVVGIEEEAARGVNAAYIVHRTLGRPYVTYKVALSMDGRTAAVDRTSKWITGEQARMDVQKLRAGSDAVCVGVGTVLADDPSLIVRLPAKGRAPLRVVVDSGARTPGPAAVLSREAPAVVFCVKGAPGERLARLRAAKAEVVEVASCGGRVCLEEMLQVLCGRGVMSLLLEGGATLAGAFREAGLIDRYVFYLAPKLLGSDGAAGAIEGWAAPNISDAAQLRIESVSRVGEDLKVIAFPQT